MAAPKNTLAALVAGLFGKSEKVISEKLSTEEFNEFAADAKSAAERITALEAEKATAEESITGLTTRATTAESRVTELEGKLTEAEADRDKYKGWFNDEKAKGKSLPNEDSSNRAESPEGLSDYNADALAHFRKINGK